MTKIEHSDGSTLRDEKKGTGNTGGVLRPERMLCFSGALTDRAVSRCQSPFSLRNPGRDYGFFVVPMLRAGMHTGLTLYPDSALLISCWQYIENSTGS
jgi:hypothetical protein